MVYFRNYWIGKQFSLLMAGWLDNFLSSWQRCETSGNVTISRCGLRTVFLFLEYPWRAWVVLTNVASCFLRYGVPSLVSWREIITVQSYFGKCATFSLILEYLTTLLLVVDLGTFYFCSLLQLCCVSDLYVWRTSSNSGQLFLSKLSSYLL